MLFPSAGPDLGRWLDGTIDKGLLTERVGHLPADRLDEVEAGLIRVMVGRLEGSQHLSIAQPNTSSSLERPHGRCLHPALSPSLQESWQHIPGTAPLHRRRARIRSVAGSRHWGHLRPATGESWLPITEPRDELLMERVARGDHDAFRALVRRHQGAVFKLAHRYLG